MNNLQRFLSFISRCIKQPGRLSQILKPSTPSQRRPPELPELEAQFYQDSDQDPERVHDRQFSASIRSGRG
jgi:hypothetical protein